MAQILARASIEDLDRFLETFRTRGAEHRREFGSKGSRLYRNLEDEHEVWAIFDWDVDRYREFLQDGTTREIMGAAGLRQPPVVVSVEEVEQLDS